MKRSTFSIPYDGGARAAYAQAVNEQDNRGRQEAIAWYDERTRSVVSGIIDAARERWNLPPEAEVVHPLASAAGSTATSCVVEAPASVAA